MYPVYLHSPTRISLYNVYNLRRAFTSCQRDRGCMCVRFPFRAPRRSDASSLAQARRRLRPYFHRFGLSHADTNYQASVKSWANYRVCAKRKKRERSYLPCDVVARFLPSDQSAEFPLTCLIYKGKTSFEKVGSNFNGFLFFVLGSTVRISGVYCSG